VEFCNSIDRLIAVLQHYNSHGELPITTKMREERKGEEDYDWFFGEDNA